MFKLKTSSHETAIGAATFAPPVSPYESDFDIKCSLHTDIGLVREINEDCARYVRPTDAELAHSKGVLAVVCDGMGGHASGEVASELAVDVVTRVYYQFAGTPEESLKHAIEEANRDIFTAARMDMNLRGMGTTCTALAICDNKVVVGHVGDSRLYVVRDGHIHLLTEDHSAVMEMVKYGIITLDEARHHADKNIILRALGTSYEVNVATWDAPAKAQAGDIYLLCSDGLYDLVDDDEIKDAIVKFMAHSTDSHKACEELIALAKERGGHDNITILIVEIKSKEAVQTRVAPVSSGEVEVS